MSTNLTVISNGKDDKDKGGRPSIYTPELAARICELVATGKHSVPQICEAVGIGYGTFFGWQKVIPEFAEAVKLAKQARHHSYNQMALSGLATLLQKHTVKEEQTEWVSDEKGNPVVRSKKITEKTFMPNPAAVIFTLKSTDPDNWTDRKLHEHTLTTTASPFEKMSREELEQEKQRLLAIRNSDAEL